MLLFKLFLVNDVKKILQVSSLARILVSRTLFIWQVLEHCQDANAERKHLEAAEELVVLFLQPRYKYYFVLYDLTKYYGG